MKWASIICVAFVDASRRYQLTLLLKGCESATWYSRACWAPSWLQHTYWSYRGSRRGAGALAGYATTSAISRRHSNATVMLVHSEVTYDITDSLCHSRLQFPTLTRRKAECPVCRASLAQFCLFDSLELDSNSEFGCYLMLPWSEKLHARHPKQERHHCVHVWIVVTDQEDCFVLYIQSTGNTQTNHRLERSRWTGRSLCPLLTAKCKYYTKASRIKNSRLRAPWLWSSPLVFGRSKVRVPLESGT